MKKFDTLCICNSVKPERNIMLKIGFLSLLVNLCIMSHVWATTTLYLDDRLDLLVLDGKRVASSLLRGAGSLELENGIHQLVVSMYASATSNNPPAFVEIITVDTRYIRQLYFTLNPALSPSTETPHIGLHDGQGRSIEVARDKLIYTRTGMTNCFEKAMLYYNRSSAIAARKDFAREPPRINCPAVTKP